MVEEQGKFSRIWGSEEDGQAWRAWKANQMEESQVTVAHSWRRGRAEKRRIETLDGD